jgi:hypothetical protein
VTRGRRGRPADGPIWSYALGRGLFAFVAVAGVGVGASLASFILGEPAYSLGTALRIGALYVGPFHHIPVVVEGHLDLDPLRLPNLPPSGATTVEIGFALLAVTALAVWLLFGAGRTLAERRGGDLGARMLAGALVAPGYAVPVFLLALLVEIEQPVELGTLVSGTIGFHLAAWQAIVFPLAIAAVSGAVGGGVSWLGTQQERHRVRVISAALAGGWRMFGIGLVLAYAGLFVAGAVQPDEAVAALTPSTARYYQAVFDRPGWGAVILTHHLALSPNEAVWALVPASGACDVVAGGPNVDVLCYGRFPHGLESVVRPLSTPIPVPRGPDLDLGRAPAGYFLFLLVPALATAFGGRAAAMRAGVGGRAAMPIGAAAGVPFATLVGAASVLASVTVRYGSTFVEGSGGSLRIGPEPLSGALLALMWGLAGGATGAATVGWSLRSRRSGRSAARRRGAPG